MKNKSEHKGKKKDNLGWEIIKLQAQVGESNSRKAKKAVEAEKKKEGISLIGLDSEASEDATKALSEATEKLLKLKEQKISQKIYQAKKEIRKAFVKAKGQETQRLIKRLKESRKAVESKNGETESTEISTEDTKKKKQDFTAEDVAKFERELELVKKMDMDTLSEHAFVTKLAKHPILGSHQLMEPYVKVADKKNGESTEKDGLIQIIEARLTNTKAVKEHMAKLWDEMEHIVTGRKVDHNELKKKRRADEQQEEPESKKTKTKQDTKGAQSNDSISGSDDEEEGEDNGEDVDMSDISDDEQDDGYDSDGLPMPKNGKATTAASMFIGSLNVGDSKKDKKDKKGKKDKNDWVDDKFDEIYGKIKKNRPGQRARRAKAELKFGKDANHVKKAEEEARQREERKAARKAKQDKLNASSANSQRVPNRRTIGAGDGSAAVHQPVQSKPKIPSGPDLNDPTLHPSWLAKQSEKAAMAAALSGNKSNKIVFDDSD
ncbi:hypothetical protein BGX27_006728 [Mortierella sp. AM989]|nr:hypothetical protein BGX27_006728 [Mortierella sp. AM989]